MVPRDILRNVYYPPLHKIWAGHLGQDTFVPKEPGPVKYFRVPRVSSPAVDPILPIISDLFPIGILHSRKFHIFPHQLPSPSDTLASGPLDFLGILFWYFSHSLCKISNAFWKLLFGSSSCWRSRITNTAGTPSRSHGFLWVIHDTSRRIFYPWLFSQMGSWRQFAVP